MVNSDGLRKRLVVMAVGTVALALCGLVLRWILEESVTTALDSSPRKPDSSPRHGAHEVPTTDTQSEVSRSQSIVSLLDMKSSIAADDLHSLIDQMARGDGNVEHPDELEDRWLGESVDEESSQALRDVVSSFESEAIETSAVKKIDCRQTLCRIELDSGPNGFAAYAGLTVLLKSPMRSSTSAADGTLVAYVNQSGVAAAQEATDPPAFPFGYWN